MISKTSRHSLILKRMFILHLMMSQPSWNSVSWFCTYNPFHTHTCESFMDLMPPPLICWILGLFTIKLWITAAKLSVILTYLYHHLPHMPQVHQIAKSGTILKLSMLFYDMHPTFPIFEVHLLHSLIVHWRLGSNSQVRLHQMETSHRPQIPNGTVLLCFPQMMIMRVC